LLQEKTGSEFPPDILMLHKEDLLSRGKFYLGFLLLLLSAEPILAQWGNTTASESSASNGSQCRDLSVRVEDMQGTGIMNATVAAEGSVFSVNTDSGGFANIPCHAIDGFLPKLNVTAQGYSPVSEMVLPNASSQYKIRLDRRDPITTSSGSTVDISELSRSTQKRSSKLLLEANKALAAKKFDSAETLLKEAYTLTPSSGPIMNNLGVVALNRNDLESAGEWFRKATEASPQNGEIRGNLGMVRWMQYRKDESYNALARASSLGYETNTGNFIMGVLELQKGECEESVPHLKEVPTDRFPYRDLYLSIALRQCGQSKAAAESYSSYLQRNPVPFFITQIR
jgi:hypothetical protein